MPPHRPTVLMTCVGGALSGELIRALRDQTELPLRVIGVDCDERAAGRHVVEAFFRVPPGADPDFLPRVLRLCQQEAVRVLIPGADEEAETIASARQAFQGLGVACAVPDLDTVRLLRNKASLMRALEKAKIAVATYQEVTTLDELRAAAGKLGYPERPFVVKPCTARGGRGALVVDASSDAMRRLFTDREPLQLSMEALEALLRRNGHLPTLLAMEYLPGDAYDVDVLCEGGEVLCLAIRRRYNKRGVPFQGCVTESHEHIEQQVRTIVAALRLQFCADIDMACSASGEPYVLEINPRLSGSVAGSIHAGVNFPLEAVRMALGLPVTPRVCRPGIETMPDLHVRVQEIA